jgi:hypothetical protein
VISGDLTDSANNPTVQTTITGQNISELTNRTAVTTTKPTETKFLATQLKQQSVRTAAEQQ